MKKPPTSFMLLSLTSFLASPAYAQSTTTMYGILDAGITMMSNVSGSRNASMDTGIMSPNLWGLQGKEDLGDGLRAVFKLEGQIDIASGATVGNLFGRQAYVGFDTDRWGTITAGNQYDFMFTSLTVTRLGPQMGTASLSFYRQGPFDALGKPNLPSGDFDFDRTAGAERIANSVEYQSPNMSGLRIGAMYGFGNQAGSVGDSNASSFGIDYAAGPFSVDAAFTSVKYASIDNGNAGIRNFGVGGRLQLDRVSFDLLYTNTRNTSTGATIHVAEAGTYVPLTPFTTIAAQYAFMLGNRQLDDNKAHQLNLTLDHNLSKRTDIYLTAAYQHAVGDDSSAKAWILGTTAASSGRNQISVRCGVRHFF